MDDFKPDRWLAGKSTSSGRTGPSTSPETAAAAVASDADRGLGFKALQDPWTFSIGPRDCAGQALARLELQVVIAAVVGNFSMKLAPEVGGWKGLLGRKMYHTTLQIRGGLPVILTPRAPLTGTECDV